MSPLVAIFALFVLSASATLAAQAGPWAPPLASAYLSRNLGQSNCTFSFNPPTWKIQAGYGLYACCPSNNAFYSGCAQGVFGSPNGDNYQATIALSADASDCPPDTNDYPYVVGASQQFSDSNLHQFQGCVDNANGWEPADVFFVVTCLQPAYGDSCVVQFNSLTITES